MDRPRERLRYGFTTGSCAAAAAKAATFMLLTGGRKDRISIETPKGIIFDAEILDIEKDRNKVKCAVRKDGGDDPDVTTGLLIYAEATRIYDSIYEIAENAERNDEVNQIEIVGGDGIGLVTKPGLDQAVGNHAINSVPRAMIEKEVREVLNLCDPECVIRITISAPGGDEVAKKTFNPRLGIEGGISILGTSGIVEPMSTEAIIETIRVEMNQKKAEGYRIISMSPGNYGLDFMAKEYGFDLEKSVKCSNFIGAACDIASELEFEEMLFVGHAGKLVKIAGGIMNTHSKEADSRMEIIAASSIEAGASLEDAKRILKSNTTEEAFQVLKRKESSSLIKKTSKYIVDKIAYYMDRRMQGSPKIECVMFTNELGILAMTDGAADLINRINNEYNNSTQSIDKK